MHGDEDDDDKDKEMEITYTKDDQGNGTVVLSEYYRQWWHRIRLTV